VWLFFEVFDAVEKEEEDAGDERETAACNCHPVAPGQVRVRRHECRRPVVTVGKTAEDGQCGRLQYDYTAHNSNNINNNNNIPRRIDQQEAQLSQRDRATLHVIEYFANSLKIIRNDNFE